MTEQVRTIFDYKKCLFFFSKYRQMFNKRIYALGEIYILDLKRILRQFAALHFAQHGVRKLEFARSFMSVRCLFKQEQELHES